jgi:hypothetical protein
MKLISAETTGFHLELQDIVSVERPPMITLPQYQGRFGRSR